EMLEWGAKTIPEGGYYSLPQRRAGEGVVVLGDAAGFVDVPSLKGIHYAMQSGMHAARLPRRVLPGRGPGRTDDAHRRAVSRRKVSDARRCRCTAPFQCGRPDG